MPRLQAILAHLFEGADLTLEITAVSTHDGGLQSEGGAEVFTAKVEVLSHEGEEEVDQLEKDESAPADVDNQMDGHVDLSNPEAAYLTLSLTDKLDILKYLCTNALGSKLVRTYIEESESQLTEFRKQRADINKERRGL